MIVFCERPSITKIYVYAQNRKTPEKKPRYEPLVGKGELH